MDAMSKRRGPRAGPATVQSHGQRRGAQAPDRSRPRGLRCALPHAWTVTVSIGSEDTHEHRRVPLFFWFSSTCWFVQKLLNCAPKSENPNCSNKSICVFRSWFKSVEAVAERFDKFCRLGRFQIDEFVLVRFFKHLRVCFGPLLKIVICCLSFPFYFWSLKSFGSVVWNCSVVSLQRSRCSSLNYSNTTFLVVVVSFC